jgi:hypothetical protein
VLPEQLLLWVLCLAAEAHIGCIRVVHTVSLR